MRETDRDNMTRNRLEKAVKMIDTLEERRYASGDAFLGTGIERMIIDRELNELAQDLYRNPGALASHMERVLARRRKTAENE